MENINFKITENDIKEYLDEHKNDEEFKYREAMFVKYMKEEKKLTREVLEILIKKYNFDDIKVGGTYHYDNSGTLTQNALQTFNSHLYHINDLDISGICHILIPTLGYYGEPGQYHKVRVDYLNLNEIVKKLGIEKINHIDFANNLNIAMYNYELVNKIDRERNIIKINMSKEHCRRELQEYSYIYKEEPVKIIRKTIRERMK